MTEITMSTQQKKLLFLVTEDWYFVAHRLALAIAAREAGYAVSVATRVRKHGDIIRAAGLKLIPFENSRSSLNPFGEFWTLVRLTRLWLREKPDVAHHVAMKPVLYGSIAARIARTPRVINALAGMGWLFTSGTGRARWLKPVVRRALRLLLKSGPVLVENPDDAKLLVHMGVPEGLIRRIAGSGVDLQRFSPQPEPGGVPVVLLCARLLWHKGVGEFVAAARLLKERGIAARFVLAGEPDQANPSAIPQDQIGQWVEEGVVEYVGWVDDMPQLLAGSCVVCLPSYYGEGIPMALIEAAASGRPIVTTDMPGCREAVHSGDNGLLVPPRNPGALADELARLIADPVLRRKMGARGRIRAEREFGADGVIRQILALYGEGHSGTRSPA
jgi:glycosyltransferase involved in cell wall biosynthesis